MKNEFLDAKLLENHVLHDYFGQTCEMLIFKMAAGGHFEFGALTELAHTFARVMGAKFLIYHT